MFGFFNIRKPPGPTSHDVVAQIRRLLAGGRGRPAFKVGHAGTLDPFAEGVLVICVGQATRLVEYLHAQPKQYHAEFFLGATSDTDDADGRISPTCGAAAPDEAAVRRALDGLVGTIRQTPPSHSAVQVAGRRAYKLARAGEPLALTPREVVVHSISLAGYQYPSLTVDVSCGGGTYIRAIARDTGEAMGVGGYCRRLIRTAVGAFRLTDAHAIEQLDPRAHLVDPLAALGGMPRLAVGAEAVERLKFGGPIPSDAPAGEVALLGASGELLAIGRSGERPGLVQPVKVFCAN